MQLEPIRLSAVVEAAPRSPLVGPPRWARLTHDVLGTIGAGTLLWWAYHMALRVAHHHG
jgi:hypothetical protein